MYCMYCRMHGGKLGWLVLSRILGDVGTQFYYRKMTGAIPLHLVLLLLVVQPSILECAILVIQAAFR